MEKKESTVSRALTELAVTLAGLAGFSLYMHLRDPTSPLRLRLAEAREQFQDWSITERVDQLIESATTAEGSETR